jgi:hypothetical protein
MENNKDILGLLTTSSNETDMKIENLYLEGLKNFRSEIRNKDGSLGRLKLHFPKSAPDVTNNNEEEGGDNEEEDMEPEM